MERGRAVERIIVVGLVALFAAEAASSMLLKSLTFDETAHIPAGYVYLTKRAFVLNREHPPLAKELAAIPLLFMRMPKVEEIAGYGDPRGEWEFGYRFLYLSGLDVERVAFAARVAMVLLGVLLGLGIYAWARRLFSLRVYEFTSSRVNNDSNSQLVNPSTREPLNSQLCAVAALGVWALSPNILAHSQLVTTDIGLCAFALWQQFFLWRFLRERKQRQIVLSAVLLGCALATKFSALVLVPLSIAQIFVSRFLRARGDVESRLTPRGVWQACAGLVAGAAIILWASYFFRVAPYPLHDYVEGLKMALRFREKWSYFFGEAKQGSWLLYFPAVFVLKTPIPTLLLACVGVVLFFKARREALDYVFLVLVPAVFFVVAVASGMNIGYRHILVVLVYAVLFAGYAVGRAWQSGRALARAGAAVLVVWYVAGSVMIAPHYLTYFTELAGGARGGARYFVDSNLDWGQELIGLRNYLARHGIERVYLSYFGTANPVAYGVPCVLLPSREVPMRTEELSQPPKPGYYAISVTNLKVAVPGHAAGYYRYFSEREPLARIGNAIYLYEIRESFGERDSSLRSE
jgi:hypothetical protein